MTIGETAKHVLDVIAGATTLAVLAKLIPVLAGLASFIWTCLRIYEMKTIQEFLRKRRLRKQIKGKK